MVDTITVHGTYVTEEWYQEDVTVEAENKIEAIRIAIAQVASKFDNNLWYFYVD
jgi:hypothetical protein